MNIVKKPLNNLQFYPIANGKTQIFWHHTAGLNAQGAIAWWNQTPDKVGTAYVIERDGTIFECFDPKLWAYHVGVKHDDDYIEKNGIGIEIVSGGCLQLEEGKYWFYPLWPNKVKRTEIPANEVWTIDNGWRGFKYFHAYTDKQIEALIELTNSLMKQFGIKVQPDMTGFYEFNKDIFEKHLPGIWSHTSVRIDKNDIIPHPSFLEKVYKAFGSGKLPEAKKAEAKSTKPNKS